MNRIVDEFRRDDERVLDKLVDNELSEADRKALLLALDDEPGAWRRCALAFLEAQTWHGDFGALLTGSALSAIEPATRLSKGAEQSLPAPVIVPASVDFTSSANGNGALAPAATSRVLEFAMALAACLLLAFGLGLWARGAWQDTNGFSGQTGPQFAKGLSPYSAPTTMVQASGPWHGTTMPGGLGSFPQLLGNSAKVELTPQAEQMLRQDSPGISEAMRKSLEQAGHRVTHTKQLVPAELPDGRRVLMPVDQVDVEPNVRPAY